MTINEAYNKGLDDAENTALDKLQKALLGLNTEPFTNPKMEEFRQKLLNMIPIATSSNDEETVSVEYIKNILLVKPDLVNDSKSYSRNTYKLISALKNLMSFISVRAEKNNNGSKNYITMMNDLKTILTNN